MDEIEYKYALIYAKLCEKVSVGWEGYLALKRLENEERQQHVKKNTKKPAQE